MTSFKNGSLCSIQCRLQVRSRSGRMVFIFFGEVRDNARPRPQIAFLDVLDLNKGKMKMHFWTIFYSNVWWNIQNYVLICSNYMSKMNDSEFQCKQVTKLIKKQYSVCCISVIHMVHFICPTAMQFYLHMQLKCLNSKSAARSQDCALQ